MFSRSHNKNASANAAAALRFLEMEKAGFLKVEAVAATGVFSRSENNNVSASAVEPVGSITEKQVHAVVETAEASRRAE